MRFYIDNKLEEKIDFGLNIDKIYKKEICTISTIYELSDESMKINKVPINYPLERLSLMSGYFFNRIDDLSFDKQHAGLIAQEVERALPEVVVKMNGKRMYHMED